MGEFFQEELALCPLSKERNPPPLCPRPLFSEAAWFQFSAGGCGLAQSISHCSEGSVLLDLELISRVG